MIFATSDALAHYIIMMYEVSKYQDFKQELEESIKVQSKNSNAVCIALSLQPFDFETQLNKLLHNIGRKQNFTRHIDALKEKGVLMENDYTICKI